MASPVSSPAIHDLTPQGLFPKVADANQNSKCISVARVIQELTATPDMKTVPQEVLQENAEIRLAFISKEERLALPDADHTAFRLFRNGVSLETAKEYISHRLSPEDIARWKIILT